MKKRIITIAVILAVLLLMTFRYSIIEQEDALPDEVRYGLLNFFGWAAAETEPPAPAETPVPTPVPTPTPEPTPVPTPEPLLERGDSGEEVKALQQRLRELGFMTGAADGKFGPKTEAAVAEFRKHIYELEQERIAAEQAAAEEQARLEAEKAEANPPADEAEAAQPQSTPDTAEATPAPAAPEEPAQEDAGSEPTESLTDESDAAGETEKAADEAQAEPVFEGKVDEAAYRLIIDREFDEYQTKILTGSRGAEVKRLQSKLKSLGYLTGKADGIFGQKTKSAVIAFQRQHKLTQDGIAGEKTQRLLYSADAKKYVPPVPKQPKGKKYLLKVSTKDQRVYAYSWNEKQGAYTNLARTMVCSTGLASTPTPKGTYTAVGPVVRWGYFPKYDVWAQYLYRIKGPYLFHSVLYDEADESTVKWGSVNKLGSPASHGCIRLSVEDARWIYNNCPAGTTVTVY